MENPSHREFDCIIGFTPSGPTEAHFRHDLDALACLGCRLSSMIADLIAELWRRGRALPVKIGVREILAERCRVLPGASG